MFAYGKHGAKAPPVFLPVRTGRAACRFAGVCQTLPFHRAKPEYASFAFAMGAPCGRK